MNEMSVARIKEDAEKGKKGVTESRNWEGVQNPRGHFGQKKANSLSRPKIVINKHGPVGNEGGNGCKGGVPHRKKKP